MYTEEQINSMQQKISAEMYCDVKNNNPTDYYSLIEIKEKSLLRQIALFRLEIEDLKRSTNIMNNAIKNQPTISKIPD